MMVGEANAATLGSHITAKGREKREQDSGPLCKFAKWAKVFWSFCPYLVTLSVNLYDLVEEIYFVYICFNPPNDGFFAESNAFKNESIASIPKKVN